MHKYIRGFSWYVVIVIILNLLQIAGNDYIAEQMDIVLAGRTIETTVMLQSILLIVLLGVFLAFFKSWLGKQFGAIMQRKLQQDICAQILNMPYKNIEHKGSGSFIQVLTSDLNIVSTFFSDKLPLFIMNFATVFFITIYFIYLDKLLICVLIICYPAMLVIAELLSKKLVLISKKYKTISDERTKMAYDIIRGVSIVKSYNLYETMKIKMTQKIDDMTKQISRSTQISSLGWMLRNVLTMFPIIACYMVALYETIAKNITVGEMMIFLVLIEQIIYPLSDIVFAVNDFKVVMISVKRLQEIVNSDVEELIIKERKIISKNEKCVIKWENVLFSYDREILKGVSFKINSGEVVAFVGESGEGKSTIFKLLLMLYEKNGGEYFLFGKRTENSFGYNRSQA